jgi:hypothetical protein
LPTPELSRKPVFSLPALAGKLVYERSKESAKPWNDDPSVCRFRKFAFLSRPDKTADKEAGFETNP